jgi:hypothetical protein
MGGPTRRRIFGDRVGGARIHAVHARKRAREAAREADAAECLLWSELQEGFGGPARLRHSYRVENNDFFNTVLRTEMTGRTPTS